MTDKIDTSAAAVEALAKHCELLHPQVQTVTLFAGTSSIIAMVLRTLVAERDALQSQITSAYELGRDDAVEKAKLVVCYQHGPYTEAGHMWSLGNLVGVEVRAVPVPADLAKRLGACAPRAALKGGDA